MTVETHRSPSAGRVRVPTEDGPMGAYVARPPNARTKGAVIVAHQLFGVTPDITGMADRLAGLGHLAIAPDFYHRSEPDVALEATDEGRARGFELLGEVTRATVRTDLRAALAWLDRHSEQAGRAVLLGVSVGGHIAYYGATQVRPPLTIALYPTFLTATNLPLGTPRPTLELTGEIGGRMLLIVGDQDAIVTAEERRAIAARLRAEGVDHEVVTVPGAQHAFLNPYGPSYDEAAGEAAWGHIERALARTARPAE